MQPALHAHVHSRDLCISDTIGVLTMAVVVKLNNRSLIAQEKYHERGPKQDTGAYLGPTAPSGRNFPDTDDAAVPSWQKAET